MRVGLIPENPLEWILDKFGFVPRALFETFHGAAQARSVMIAAKLGVFEVLAHEPRTVEQIAAATGTNIRALEKLLNVLLNCNYLTLKKGTWGLRLHARRWILRSSKRSIADNLLHRFTEWEAMENLEQFVRTGEPMELHDHLPPNGWPAYQRGMKSLANLAVGEVVARTVLPWNPRRMLDIGGSHGLYSVKFCRRYPTLEAVVLDLPEAIEQSAPLLAEEGMGARVVHRAGDVMTDSLGEREWDFVFISQLMHHLTSETNEALCVRIARALKPGGVLVIAEIEKTTVPKSGGQIGAIFDLFFSATSRSGTWSVPDMQAWQTRAGLQMMTPKWLWTVPGIVLVAGQAT